MIAALLKGMENTTEAAGTVNSFQLPPQPRLNKTLGHAKPKSDFAVTFVSRLFFRKICSPRKLQTRFVYNINFFYLKGHDNEKDLI